MGKERGDIESRALLLSSESPPVVERFELLPLPPDEISDALLLLPCASRLLLANDPELDPTCLVFGSRGLSLPSSRSPESAVDRWRCRGWSGADEVSFELVSFGGSARVEGGEEDVGDWLVLLLLMRGDDGLEKDGTEDSLTALIVLYSSVSAFILVITERIPEKI